MRLNYQTLELTEDHLKLARRMYIDWNDDAYDGAPTVGLKRPYGNSHVINDLYEIVYGREWNYEPDGLQIEERNPDLHTSLMKLHREMEFVLQILCIHAGEAVTPGLFVKQDRYNDRSWKRAAA